MRYGLIGIVVALLLAQPARAECDRGCVEALEDYAKLEQELTALRERQQDRTVRFLLGFGYDVGAVAKERPDLAPKLAPYLAAERRLLDQWYSRMRQRWTGPQSENETVMRKMIYGAFEYCQQVCY